MRASHVRRRVSVLLAALLWAAVPSSGAPGSHDGGRTSAVRAAQDDDTSWQQRVEAWCRAVAEHEPGTMDDGAILVSAWTADQLRRVVDDYLELRRSFDGLAGKVAAEKDARTRHFVTYRRQPFTLGDLARILGPAARQRPNGALKRGAVLHADVARLAVFDLSRATGSDDVVLFEDGRVVGYGSHSMHWRLGRELLDAVTPSPSEDAFVPQWYHATLAALLSAGNFAEAEIHLAHGLDVLPRSAAVHYEAGIYHQALTAPDIAAAWALQRQVGPTGQRRSGSTMRESTTERHLDAAERHFRKAIDLDPGFSEAKIRLAHTLLELPREADARPLLRQAIDETDDRTLTYYAALLLGRAEARAGRPGAAAAQFTRAAELYPMAQSPVLAMSHLVRVAGDQEAALTHLKALAPGGNWAERRFDPWWNYYRWQQRSADELMKAVGELARLE